MSHLNNFPGYSAKPLVILLEQAQGREAVVFIPKVSTEALGDVALLPLCDKKAKETVWVITLHN